MISIFRSKTGLPRQEKAYSPYSFVNRRFEICSSVSLSRRGIRSAPVSGRGEYAAFSLRGQHFWHSSHPKISGVLRRIFFLLHLRLLSLREVRFASPRIEPFVGKRFSGACRETAGAAAAVHRKRGVRRKCQSGQYGSDGKVRTVLRMDEAVVPAEKPSPAW